MSSPRNIAASAHERPSRPSPFRSSAKQSQCCRGALGEHAIDHLDGRDGDPDMEQDDPDENVDAERPDWSTDRRAAGTHGPASAVGISLTGRVP